MPKPTTKFVCSECGYESARWLGKCPDCGTFGTMNEETVEIRPKSKSAPMQTKIGVSDLKPVPISEISDSEAERISCGIPEFDTVLGGGIVPSSMILIGGDPGIGKSTILTQALGHLSKTHSALYVSAEESVSQVKMRCNRLNVSGCGLQVINETRLEKIEALLLSSPYEFVVIDSIQAVYLSDMASSSGSVSQVKECAGRLMRLSKNLGITIFIIGHVTKEGNFAGPKVLEHIMDTVLYFEGDPSSSYKILRAVKNRFGSTNEVGILQMTESGIVGVSSPSKILLSESYGESAGSVATPVIEGSRCMLVEVQSLTSQTAFGMPRRMAGGIDYNKFVLLLAVLEKKAGVSLYNQDAYLSVMSGIRIFEPSADLAVLCSVLSAVKNQPVSKGFAVFGEVGLTGEVRPVREAQKRIGECFKMGFRKIILPKANLKEACGKQPENAELIGIKYVWELKKLI